MKSSPIYNFVYVPDRKTDKDFGAGNQGFDQYIRVGTSSSNSHRFAEISVRRYMRDNGTVEFCLRVDGAIVKRGILTGQEFNFTGIEE